VPRVATLTHWREIYVVAKTPVSFDVNLPSYISGYVDGEGCFTVSFSKRMKMRGGWEVRPSFSVSQNSDRAEVLLEIQEYFECGTIRPDRSDKTMKFEVRSISNLVNSVIPHFERYPLRSSKQRDFEFFARVCQLVRAGGHLTPDGFHKVVELATQMNGSGRRKYCATEMLDNSKFKVIVSASRNGG
jgi:LAGLIDADG endonuclease